MSNQAITVEVVAGRQLVVEVPPQELLQLEAEVSVISPSQVAILEGIRNDSEAARDRAITSETNAANSESLTEGYRDESLQFRDTSEGYRDESLDLKDQTDSLHQATTVLHDHVVVLHDEAEGFAEQSDQRASDSESARDDSQTARDDSQTARDQSVTSAAESKQSAAASNASQIAASLSEQAASDSQDAAKVSETASKNSEEASAENSASAMASKKASAQSAEASAGSASESEQSAAAAKASELASKQSEDNALASKESAAQSSMASETSSQASAASAQLSDDHQQSADGSRQAAAGSATEASAAQVASELASDLSRRWATEDYDTPVEEDKYSSLHWSEVARQYAASMTNGMYFAGRWDMDDGLPPEPTDDRVPWYRIVNNDVNDRVPENAIWRALVDESNKGDQLVWDPIAKEWFLIDTSDEIWTVNGQKGNVVLDADDVGAVATSGGTVTGQLTLNGSVLNQLRLHRPGISEWKIGATEGAGNFALYRGSDNKPSLWISHESSYNFRVDGSGGSRIYHQAFKPTAADVGLGNVDNVKQVPVTRTVNGKPLSADIALSAADVGAWPASYVPGWDEITGKPSTYPPAVHHHDDDYAAKSHSHSNYVVTTRTINGKPLSEDITLTAGDVGARPSNWVPSWSDVTDKPDTYPPSSHNHSEYVVKDDSRLADNTVAYWMKMYAVPADTLVPLTDYDGQPLNINYLYEVTACTTKTGTRTGTKAVFWYQNGWARHIVSSSSTSSNHPRFELNSEGTPCVAHNHANSYTVRVIFNRLIPGNTNVHRDYFGLNGHLRADDNLFQYREQNVYHTGNKPTASDVGLSNVDNVKQLPITGGTMTGNLIVKGNHHIEIQAENAKGYAAIMGTSATDNEYLFGGKAAGETNIGPYVRVGTGTFTYSNGSNSYGIYHTGRKPTAAEVNAVSSDDSGFRARRDTGYEFPITGLTSGNWARGAGYFRASDNAQGRFVIGCYGIANEATRFTVGEGNWWSSGCWLSADKEGVYVGSDRWPVYHMDNKPTPSDIGAEPTLDADRKRKITISTEEPSGGSDGDIWFLIKE